MKTTKYFLSTMAQSHLKFLVFTIAIAGFIGSCSKSKSDPVVAGSPLIGSWKIATLNVTGCTDPSTNYSSTNCCGAGGTCCGAIGFTATTMTSTGPSGLGDKPYTVAGNTIHFDGDDGGVQFNVVGTKLTLDYQQSPGVGKCHMVSTYTKI